MAQNQYQEPIEKEDMNLKDKFSAQGGSASGGQNPESAEMTVPEKPLDKEQVPSRPEAEKVGEAKEKEGETTAEAQKEEVGEKIETARQTIQTQKSAAATVATDAQAVSGIAEYEKKIEKLVELALQKGPEHAIRVARHLDKGKNISEADNYTLDEIHDKLVEEELRKQLIQKGLLKDI